MKKIKKMFYYLNPKNVFCDITYYGSTVSTKSYLSFLLLCYVGVIIFGIVFKLKLPYILILAAVATLMMPITYTLQYKNIYEQKKFNTVTSYMEQMLYSFKRHKKILTALYDTRVMFDVKENRSIREAIDLAIDKIEKGEYGYNIYNEALSEIEKAFPCKRVKKMHNLFIKMEESGGDVHSSIDILLIDKTLWMDSIFNLVSEKKKIKVNVTIAIALSFLISVLSIYMIPNKFGIVQQTASQVATTITTIINMIIWCYVQIKLSGNLLTVDKNAPYESMKRSLNYIKSYNKKRGRIFVIFGILLILVSAYAYITKIIPMFLAIVCVIFSIIVMTQPSRKYKICKKRVSKEVEKVFPEWLLSLALQLQTDNVYVSISKTLLDAPEILKEPLVELQEKLEETPGDIKPFVEFLKEYNIVEIEAAMKMIYSLSEFGTDDAQEQIKNIVERNTKMMNKAEENKIQDELAGITFTMLLPMISGTCKILTDLVLLMGYVLSSLSGI